MKRISQMFTVIGLVILTNCASNIKSKSYTDNDFKTYKTFAYLPNTAFKVEDFNKATDQSVEATLIAAMNDKMMEKGFTIDTNNPDILVFLTTSNEVKSNLKNSKNYYEQAPERGGTAGNNSPNYASVSSNDYKRYLSNNEDAFYNKAYKNGSLIVEVFSSQTKELLWIGIAENFTAHISDQTLTTRMINEIFKAFPR